VDVGVRKDNGMQSRFTRVVVLVVGVALAAAGCGKYSISNIRALKAFQDGSDAYKKGDFAGAITHYQESIDHNPEFGFAYFFLGNSYDNLFKPARKGDPANDQNLVKATEYYRTAIQKLATSPEPQAPMIRQRSYEFLIAAYGPDKLNDFSQAEPLALELISIDPNEPGNYSALSRLYEDQGRYDEAEAILQKLAAQRPNDPLTYQFLAGFYDRQGNFEKTIEAWKQRANAEPMNPEAWQAIATFYFDEIFRNTSLRAAVAREYAIEGIQATDRAIALNSDYYEAVAYKNILLRQQALKERDPAVQKKLIAEADVLEKRAIELRDRQAGQAMADAAAAKTGQK
jgi:tetratricopeptide (TPR) repeat protein